MTMQHYDVTVQQIGHYNTGTPQNIIGSKKIKLDFQGHLVIKLS